MALTAEKRRRALIAFQRFGLGARPGAFDRVAKNAKKALVEEVNKAGIATIKNKKLPSYAKAASKSQQDFDDQETIRRAELAARIDKHMSVQIGFVERLVIFWSNHFSMSVEKSGAIRGMMGQLERDVIRKHVLGNFSDMLIGVIKHPAMISFLDNDDSVGPNSPYGSQRSLGFNENLAREIMELHTLGSGGGYTEEDVTQLSLILTGWSYVRGWESDYGYNGGNKKNRGKYIYRSSWHEPGSIKLRGRNYKAQGQKQAIKALENLAKDPATAEHIAFKLVRHFITDEPTPEMVDPIAKRFRDTNGNLKKVSLALLDLPEAFEAPLTKLRTPYELAVAQFRAMKFRYKEDQYWTFASPLYSLRNMVWECPSPEGYPDETLYWLDPDSMTLRLDTAQLASWVYDDRYKGDVVKLAKALFGTNLTKDTRERIELAGSLSGSLTMLFAAPNSSGGNGHGL